MKTTARLFLLALIISLASCSKSNDDSVNPSSSNKTEQVKGNWTVTYYFDSGKDETSDFAGYQFTFNTNNELLATNGSSSFTGSWRIGDNSSDDDNSSNRLVINITGNKAMDHLQDDWVIISLTASQIQLQDDNPASMEELHFGRTNQ